MLCDNHSCVVVHYSQTQIYTKHIISRLSFTLFLRYSEQDVNLFIISTKYLQDTCSYGAVTWVTCIHFCHVLLPLVNTIVALKLLPICWHSKLLQKLTRKKWKIKKTALEKQANCKRQLNVPWWRKTEALSVWAHSYPNSAVYLFTKVENQWPIMTKVLRGCNIKILLWWNESDFHSSQYNPHRLHLEADNFSTMFCIQLCSIQRTTVQWWTV